MKYLIFIPIFLSIASSMAQNDFAKLDSHADNVPERLKSSIPVLVNYLTSQSKTDLDKVRVIFRWITQNINYDVEAFFDRRLIVDDPQRVIRRGLAVCGGYSNLFNRMCREAGIQSKLIAGWSKGYGERLTTSPNHAWNAVKIDYKWFLLDATWGAGHINSDQKFTREFNDYYFLTDPEQLIYDHFPEDKFWQLLQKPIGRKQFDNLVLVRPAFFKNGLKLISHPNAKIVSTGLLTVEIEAPQSKFLSVQLLKNNVQLPNHHCFAQRRDGSYSIQVRFPDEGNYILRLFTKEGQETIKFNWACDYKVEVKTKLAGNNFFAKQYGKFFDLDVFLYEPVDFFLAANTTQYFKIELENALAVAIVSGNEFFPLKKTNNIFEGSIIVPKDLFHIAVKTDTTNTYHWLLEYEGR